MITGWDSDSKTISIIIKIFQNNRKSMICQGFYTVVKQFVSIFHQLFWQTRIAMLLHFIELI